MSRVQLDMDAVRGPRLAAPRMPDGELTVESPPPVPKPVVVHPLARLLPAAMLVAALGMMAVYFTSGATATRSPMFMFFPVMMVSSVLGTLAYGARGTNRLNEINRDRQTYLRYLDTVDAAIAAATDDQRRSLQWHHPEPGSLWCLVGGPRMWERTSDDPEFCHVRVGHGERPLATSLKAPALDPVVELDPVTVNAMRRLVRRRAVASDMPITVKLPALFAVAVGGERDDARALVRSMVCQLAVLHGPEHVAIAAVIGPDTHDHWDWLKWLPHHAHPRTIDAAGPARRVYGTLTHALNDAMAPEDARPQRVVVIVDGGAAAGAKLPGPGAGVTVVFIGEAPDHLPTADCLRLHVDGDISRCAQTIARRRRRGPTP